MLVQDWTSMEITTESEEIWWFYDDIISECRAQAKDAMEQYDKATTMTSTTTIQLQNGPVWDGHI